MKNKIIKHPYLSILISMVCGVLITLAIGFGIQSNIKNSPIGRVASVYSQIEHDYYRKVDDKKLAQGAINGMLDSLNDPFSNYLTDNDATELNDSVSGSFGGVGIQVIQKDGYVEIMSTIDGTPAQKANLKAGDRIIAVNGTKLKKNGINQATQLMRGKVGTKVKIQLQRGSSTFTKEITRAAIPVDTVTGKMLKNKVGYISISSVSENTSSELKTQLKKLDKKGAKSYIIDVRNNPGGLMDEALKMSSMFVKDGKTILRVKDRNHKEEVYKAGKEYDGGYKVTKPSVVLINGESASAAEIFAAALHDSANIKLVGSKSYGKGTVQNISQYKDQAELKLTIAKWLTPNGKWIHHHGLTPEYKADYPDMAYITEFDEKKSYQVGDSNADVKNLKIALKDLGYFKGKLNNEFTSNTKLALEQFQTDNKIAVTGKFDKKTMQVLENKIVTTLQKNDPALKKAEDVVND